MCDLIHQRVDLINKERLPPEDLMESICTILYCSQRIDIRELKGISKQFALKYGEKWLKKNKENRSGMVSQKVETALSPKPPTMEDVQKKLVQIAAENAVDWCPEVDKETNLQIVKYTEEKTVETDPIMVNRMVEILSDPKAFDVSDDQKKEMMRKKGCNAAEAAAALHIVTEKWRDGSVRQKHPDAPPPTSHEGVPSYPQEGVPISGETH